MGLRDDESFNSPGGTVLAVQTFIPSDRMIKVIPSITHISANLKSLDLIHYSKFNLKKFLKVKLTPTVCAVKNWACAENGRRHKGIKSKVNSIN